MKSILTLSMAALIFAACNTNHQEKQIAKHETLFKRSYELKDLNTAITAVHLVMLADSTHYLRDSLPALYLATQNVEACLATTNEVLKRKPADEELLKYKLLCLEQMGKGEELLTLATSLYTKTKKVEYIYKIASVQLVGGDFETATKTINTMMENYKDSKDSVDIFIDQSQSQRVPITAACYNMKGYVFIQTQKYQQAAEAYQKAIQLFPDFVMARRNLQQLIQSMQQGR